MNQNAGCHPLAFASTQVSTGHEHTPHTHTHLTLTHTHMPTQPNTQIIAVEDQNLTKSE